MNVKTGSTATYISNIPAIQEEFGDISTGIEPFFSWEYFRAGRLGVTKQAVKLAQDYMDKHGLKSIDELPDYFATAMDLTPQEHVDVQATIQKWTDSSISKTANCPEDFTVEDTNELYMRGYDKGLKGITIYRANSRKAQVLATKEEDAKLETHLEKQQVKNIDTTENSSQAIGTAGTITAGTITAETITSGTITAESVSFANIDQKNFTPESIIQKRPKRLYGFTDKVRFMYGDKQGKAYVTINKFDNDVWEVFITTKEKEISAMAKALGLMTTKLLRLGATSDNLQQAIDTLSYDQTFGTLPHQVAQILKEVQKENLERKQKESGEIKLNKCSECGNDTYDKVNCICYSCGMSTCN